MNTLHPPERSPWDASAAPRPCYLCRHAAAGQDLPVDADTDAASGCALTGAQLSDAVPSTEAVTPPNHIHESPQ